MKPIFPISKKVANFFFLYFNFVFFKQRHKKNSIKRLQKYKNNNFTTDRDF